MCETADAVELASIRMHWVAGAPLTFALCLKRMSQRGLHLPTEFAQRIWERLITLDIESTMAATPMLLKPSREMYVPS